ncbi:hypothetical protein C8R46DRAFT_1058662 [Mycena filopes]|nr:hypothetical protein C8R46DRAFT_1058662 [Mycena filopes]
MPDPVGNGMDRVEISQIDATDPGISTTVADRLEALYAEADAEEQARKKKKGSRKRKRTGAGDDDSTDTPASKKPDPNGSGDNRRRSDRPTKFECSECGGKEVISANLYYCTDCRFHQGEAARLSAAAAQSFVGTLSAIDGGIKLEPVSTMPAGSAAQSQVEPVLSKPLVSGPPHQMHTSSSHSEQNAIVVPSITKAPSITTGGGTNSKQYPRKLILKGPAMPGSGAPPPVSIYLSGRPDQPSASQDVPAMPPIGALNDLNHTRSPHTEQCRTEGIPVAGASSTSSEVRRCANPACGTTTSPYYWGRSALVPDGSRLCYTCTRYAKKHNTLRSWELVERALRAAARKALVATCQSHPPPTPSFTIPHAAPSPSAQNCHAT